jgi:hypothetical protein
VWLLMVSAAVTIALALLLWLLVGAF